MEKIGIEETKELLEWGFAVQEAISGSLEDGKINLADAPRFFPALVKSAKGIGGINKVGAELLDLSPTEEVELLDFVRERFDLPDDRLELLIEDTLYQLLEIYRTSRRWADYRRAA